jgi:hypothetical protein
VKRKHIVVYCGRVGHQSDIVIGVGMYRVSEKNRIIYRNVWVYPPHILYMLADGTSWSFDIFRTMFVGRSLISCWG